MKIESSNKLLLLSKDDNVLVALGATQAGEVALVDGHKITVQTPVTLGHKIARANIAAGDKVLKYGVSIGSATIDISVGQHVHVHNMKSDYTATYMLSETADGSQADGGKDD